MKILDQLRLRLRANKYKNRDDIGGIAFILDSIKPGQIVMDIGAHKAGYLYFMLQQTGSSGKIYAFEPQSSLYHYIVHLKKISGWHNVTIEHLALSDSAGKVTLFIPANKKSKGNSPGATIVEHQERTGSDLQEEVNTQTLDNYCREKNVKPDFLKIDVEGNELRIFKGGRETIQTYKPKILVEIEARHIGEDKVRETWTFLQDMGYTGQFIHGTERKPLSEFSFQAHQNTGDMKNYCNNFIFEHR